ncbi:hypothetical protein ACLKA6_004533 [Drosophila palustris]
MRNGIPGVLIEGYSASVSLLVAIGTCCGAGAAQVQSNIALGHLSPMLFNNKENIFMARQPVANCSSKTNVSTIATRHHKKSSRALQITLSRPMVSSHSGITLHTARLWATYSATQDFSSSELSSGVGPNPGPQSITDIDTLSIISNSCNLLTLTSLTNKTKTKRKQTRNKRKKKLQQQKLINRIHFGWTQAYPPCLRRNHSSPP